MTRPTLFALVVLGMFAALEATAGAKISLEHNGQFTYYPADSLQAVLDAAQDGDQVLLPGTSFTGNFTLNQKISMFGVGYFPDSCAATGTSVIAGGLRLGEGASGSYFSGFKVTSSIAPITHNADVDDIYISRCDVGSIGSTSYFGDNSSEWYITESVLGRIDPRLSWIIRNCLIDAQIGGGQNTIIENCILTLNNNLQIYSCYNCVVRGNIFTGSSTGISSSSSLWSTVTHNVFVDPNPTFTYCTDQSNVKGVDVSSLFVNYNGNQSINYAMDFRLAPNSPAAGAGPGGIDCGVYGGPSPWKAGGVPYPPHIQEQYVGTATDPMGNLPVQVKVAAQGN